METAIYCRVSTEEQAMEGYSIRGQTEKLKAYVSAKSWAIYDVYLDEGISGKNITERPAINRMIDDIKSGNVKNVVIFKLDRLTRSVADLMYLIDLFKQYNCAFNSLSESIDTSTASGRMFIKIIGIFAEFERENIGERVRLGKERKAREGYTTSSRYQSFGYDRELGERVQRINKNEAATVRRIFDMYVNQNVSMAQIAKALNKEKIKSKTGAAWSTGSIKSLLENCNYAGRVRYGMEQPERAFESEGKHEPIISDEMFQQAQIILERNKYIAPTKKPIERNYFNGFLKCGVCGRNMKSHIIYCRGTPLYNFECMDRTFSACMAKRVSAKKLEVAVIEYFNNIPETATDIEQAENEKAKTAAQIELLKEKMAALEVKEKEMLDTYIEDKISLLQYRDYKTRLDGEIKKVVDEIEKLTPKEKLKLKSVQPVTREEIIHYFKENWTSLDDVEKRQFLLKHINKITVINHPVKNSNRGKTEITDIHFNTD